MSTQPAFLTNSLSKLLEKIDREILRLQQMKTNRRVSSGVQQEIDNKVTELRRTRLEITQLMSRLERP